MNAGVGAISGLALVVAAWLWWHRDAPKFTTFLALVAGFGFGGVLGALIGNVLNRALDTAGSTTSNWVGISAATFVSAIALVATLEVFIKGMWPKKAKPTRWHPFLALLLPTIVIATGVPLLTEVMGAFSSGVGNLGGAVTGQLGGG